MGRKIDQILVFLVGIAGDYDPSLGVDNLKRINAEEGKGNKK